MSMTVSHIMREIRNYFPASFHDAAWTLSGGILSPKIDLPPEGWIAISGSLRNNGVHHLTGGALPAAVDEAWTGRVWLLAPPQDFLDLCARIASWSDAHQDAGVIRESFGAYSRTCASAAGRAITWQEAFSADLAPYRRMFSEVNC